MDQRINLFSFQDYFAFQIVPDLGEDPNGVSAIVQLVNSLQAKASIPHAHQFIYQQFYFQSTHMTPGFRSVQL